MKVLVATAMYPSEERPAFGTFVRTQVESLRAIGVDVEPFVLDGRSRKMMYPAAVPELRRVLASDPTIDVVHAHYGYVGLVARAQRRAPVVVTFHGDDLLGTVDARGRTVRASRVVSAMGRALARRVDVAIVQNTRMAELLSDEVDVRVVPCEVDLDLFRPADRSDACAQVGLDPERRHVLFAANPEIPVKRFPLARAAVDRLRSGRADVELVVVHREPQVRLVDFMNACDVLVFPSFQEGSPNIVKQAMACNLPVVATDVGDVRDVIGSTAGCAIVEPEVEAVAAGLAAALDRGARTDGRQQVERFRPEIIAGELLAVYRAAIGATVATPAAGGGR